NRSEFFNPTVSQIIENLREMNVILTASGDLVKPEYARFVSKEIRDLFGADELPAFFEKIHLVDPLLDGDHYRKRLESIGVVDLTEEEFLECLRDENWIISHDTEWFHTLYEYLKTLGSISKEQLSNIKLIPVRSGQILRPEDKSGVYLPNNTADEMVK